MDDLIFITGNQYKADYLARWLGRRVEHRKADLTELQSLDSHAVVKHKVKAAYDIVQRPVLVEDVSLTCPAMGRLPGTLIRWFLEELGTQGLCDLFNKYDDKRLVASIIYALHDGTEVQFFEASVAGTVSSELRGESHGWNVLFVPDGFEKTFAEMTDEEFNVHSHRGRALKKLKAYLDTMAIIP